MTIVAVDNNQADLNHLADTITALFPKSRLYKFTDPLISAKHIYNNPTDIVFLTDNMRPANGFKLMRVLRANLPKLTIVMLSEKEENRTDAFRAGADDYLVKPVSLNFLGETIKQIS